MQPAACLVAFAERSDLELLTRVRDLIDCTAADYEVKSRLMDVQELLQPRVCRYSIIFKINLINLIAGLHQLFIN